MSLLQRHCKKYISKKHFFVKKSKETGANKQVFKSTVFVQNTIAFAGWKES